MERVAADLDEGIVAAMGDAAAFIEGGIERAAEEAKEAIEDEFLAFEEAIGVDVDGAFEDAGDALQNVVGKVKGKSPFGGLFGFGRRTRKKKEKDDTKDDSKAAGQDEDKSDSDEEEQAEGGA